MEIILRGSFPGDSCPRGNYPGLIFLGDNCPDTPVSGCIVLLKCGLSTTNQITEEKKNFEWTMYLEVAINASFIEIGDKK